MALRPEVSETIRMCRHCFMCRHANPTFLVTKLDAHTPRGYALALSRIDEGSGAWTDELAAKLHQSTMDGLCAELCEFRWREDLVIQAGRREAVLAGVAPEAALRAAERRGAAGGTGEAIRGELPVPAGRIDRVGADVLLITGRVARERAPSTIAATAALLDRLGCDWSVPAAEPDPGIDLWELGRDEAAQASADAFAAEVERLRPARIVTGSARVLRVLRGAVPGLDPGGLPPSEHITESLLGNLDALTAGAGAVPWPGPVAYHDPCSLGRRLGITDPPRRIIEALTGTPPLEFAHSRAIAECCGEGGLLPELDPDLAGRLAAAQLGRLPAAARTLVTASPECRALLADAATRAGGDISVMDITELAARVPVPPAGTDA